MSAHHDKRKNLQDKNLYEAESYEVKMARGCTNLQKDELRWMKCALETNKYTNEGESLDSIGRLPKGEKKCKKKKEKKKKITAMKNEWWSPSPNLRRFTLLLINFSPMIATLWLEQSLSEI